MKEQTRLFLILAFPFFLFGAYSLLQSIESDSFVSNYDLTINVLSDKIEVTENLTYTLASNRFRELYRTYDKIGPQKNLYVTSFYCPIGSIFSAPAYNTYFELICKKENYYDVGEHEISFSYEIPSPYVCYDDYCELFWTIMNNFGSKIEDVTINVNGNIFDLSSFPNGQIQNNNILIKTIPKESIFEIRILIPRENIESSYQTKPGEILPEFKKYSNYSRFYTFLYNYRLTIIFSMISLTAFLLYNLFTRSGREKEVRGIPDVLHYAPSKLKPYEVDFLFSGNIGAFEGDVIDATLLDLIKRGYLKIKGNTIEILKVSDSTLNTFEKRIINFYAKYAENNIFDAKAFKKQVSKMSQFKAKMILNELNELRNPTKDLFQKLKDIFNTKPKKTAVTILGFFGVLSLFILLISIGLNLMYLPQLSLTLLIIYSLWTFVLIKLDDYVFGKYKEDVIEEKLKWDAFKNLFKNYSMIEKYKPQDISMWGDWLSYATVFGLAKNVIKIMKKHKIALPNIDDPIRVSRINRLIWSTTRIAATPKSSSSGFSGGIGGGFGGGGGGAR